MLDEKILKRVVSCILGLNDKRILNLTESSYMGLIIHVTIAINRILKQEILKEEEGGLYNLRNESEYELASYITAALEREFEISIPEIETAYICLHIKGSKRQNVEIDEKSRELIQEQKHLMEIVNRMIDAYDEENGWLLKQDEEFIRGLLAHLMPTMTRLSNGMRIKNPLLEQIKEDYPEIFKKCQGLSGFWRRRQKRRYQRRKPDSWLFTLGRRLFGWRMKRRTGERFISALCVPVALVYPA